MKWPFFYQMTLKERRPPSKNRIANFKSQRAVKRNFHVRAKTYIAKCANDFNVYKTGQCHHRRRQAASLFLHSTQHAIRISTA